MLPPAHAPRGRVGCGVIITGSAHGGSAVGGTPWQLQQGLGGDGAQGQKTMIRPRICVANLKAASALITLTASTTHVDVPGLLSTAARGHRPRVGRQLQGTGGLVCDAGAVWGRRVAITLTTRNRQGWQPRTGLQKGQLPRCATWNPVPGTEQSVLDVQHAWVECGHAPWRGARATEPSAAAVGPGPGSKREGATACATAASIRNCCRPFLQRHPAASAPTHHRRQ